MYLSNEACKSLQYVSEPVKGAFRVIFGKPVRTLPDGATLWHTPLTSWEWEEGHPLVKFLRSLDRDKGEVFEVLFLKEQDRVVHEYNLRPDEDEMLGTKVSFTFMQEDFFEESEKELKYIPPRCENCRFWSFTSKDNGLCRFNPPVIIHEIDYAQWPVTYKDSWCGKFAKED